MASYSPHARSVLWGATLIATALLSQHALAGPILSDGSDGPFHPTSNTTLTLPADGIFNFTTINIPSGVTVTFNRNATNTGVVLGATGDVNIAGTLQASASGRTAGVGGGDGGLNGNSSRRDGTAGAGPGGGDGGGGSDAVSQLGRAGGGGGNATPGLTATSRTGSPPAAGGPAVGVPSPIAGGSGGGGGGRGRLFGVDLSGGAGGGAGGGISITTPGTMTVSGNIFVNGAHGGVAFANIFSHGGPGGGGSGGNVNLEAGTLNLTSTANISARGGAGGGLSTETVANDPFRFSSGANGGLGYLDVWATTVNQDPGSTINAVPNGFTPVGFGPTNPFLPGTGTPPWVFNDIVVLPNAPGSILPFWFDPVVAVGYTYETTGGTMSSIHLPTGFGDNLFNLQLINPSTSLFETVATLTGGTPFDLVGLNPFGTTLTRGVDTLRVTGIEPSAGVDPDDPLAFATGLTFLGPAGQNVTAGFEVDLTMTPLTQNTGPPGTTPVPEPSSLVLLALGALPIVVCRRRRRTNA